MSEADAVAYLTPETAPPSDTFTPDAALRIDPWMRFDTWAGECRRLGDKAIEIESARTAETDVSSAARVAWWVADLYKDLAIAAVASVPKPDAVTSGNDTTTTE